MSNIIPSRQSFIDTYINHSYISKKKEIDNELLKKYMFNIRNSLPLSKPDLININNMSYDDRMEILSLYNEMIICYLKAFIEK